MPVEERIDHEEIAKKLSRGIPPTTMQTVSQADWQSFGRAYLALLTEHSAYREALEWIHGFSLPGRSEADERVRAVAGKALGAAPLATESAQPEEGPGSYAEACSDLGEGADPGVR